jgi:hypothetical protein
MILPSGNGGSSKRSRLPMNRSISDPADSLSAYLDHFRDARSAARDPQSIKPTRSSSLRLKEVGDLPPHTLCWIRCEEVLSMGRAVEDDQRFGLGALPAMNNVKKTAPSVGTLQRYHCFGEVRIVETLHVCVGDSRP